MIARWLCQSATLLILDEPFQGVDIKARRDIGRYIRETKSKRATVVFATELDEALEIADKIIIMHEKEIIGNHVNDKIDLVKVMTQFSGHAHDRNIKAS
jgi:simple sugar transport system ATP-binding protein